jgi:hypothetical protein
MLPFEALSFGLRGAEERFEGVSAKHEDEESGEGMPCLTMDFGVSVGAGAVVVCR